MGAGAGAALGSYVGISALMARGLTRTQRRMVHDTPGSLGLDYAELRFRSRGDGVILAGWLIRPPHEGLIQSPEVDDASLKWIVIVHGHSAHRADPEAGTLSLARDMLNAGYAVMMFDMRGCGQSGDGAGSAGQREQRDLLGALDYLANLGVPRVNIGVIGFSLGAVVSLMACSAPGTAGAVVADSAFADLQLRIDQEMVGMSAPARLFRPGMRIAARLLYRLDIGSVSPMRRIGHSDTPVLLIHGERDDLVPLIHFRLLSRALEAGVGETWLVDGAGHVKAYRSDPDEYARRVCEFFERHLGESLSG